MKTTKTTFTIVSALASVILLTSCGSTVSYTHLDVYKRQVVASSCIVVLKTNFSSLFITIFTNSPPIGL